MRASSSSSTVPKRCFRRRAASCVRLSTSRRTRSSCTRWPTASRALEGFWFFRWSRYCCFTYIYTYRPPKLECSYLSPSVAIGSRHQRDRACDACDGSWYCCGSASSRLSSVACRTASSAFFSLTHSARHCVVGPFRPCAWVYAERVSMVALLPFLCSASSLSLQSRLPSTSSRSRT
jgi:hypothetical protein